MDKKVLVISRNAWSNKISTGNTLSNFFANWDKDCLANIYCRAEEIDNDICLKYYQITENDLIRSILHKGTIAGNIKQKEDTRTKDNKINKKSKKLYGFFRNKRWTVFLWGRELLWKFGKWKNSSFRLFIKEFDPDIIYMPIYDCFYMHDLLVYVSKISNAKIVLFTGDDMYSLRQFSVSPLYWINRFILRKKIRKSVELADKCYCLSKEQAEEYEGYFHKEFKLLTKEIKSNNIHFPSQKENKDIVTMVYTGNIDKGRFESLYTIARSLENIELGNKQVMMYIYSGSILTKSMIKKLKCLKKTQFMGEVEATKVFEIQRNADIVIHVESLRLKQRLETRLSLSTKLIDYMQNGCCIFAYGWEKASSILFLKQTRGAMIVTKEKDVEKSLYNLIENNRIRKKLAWNAYKYVKENNKSGKNYEILHNDFNLL